MVRSGTLGQSYLKGLIFGDNPRSASSRQAVVHMMGLLSPPLVCLLDPIRSRLDPQVRLVPIAFQVPLVIQASQVLVVR